MPYGTSITSLISFLFLLMIDPNTTGLLALNTRAFAFVFPRIILLQTSAQLTLTYLLYIFSSNLIFLVKISLTTYLHPIKSFFLLLPFFYFLHSIYLLLIYYIIYLCVYCLSLLGCMFHEGKGICCVYYILNAQKVPAHGRCSIYIYFC